MSTADDYISNARASREEDVRALLDAEAADERTTDGEDPSDALDALPLEVAIEKHIVIVLSTGGPHEEIDAVVDDHGYVMSAAFRAVWGGDRVETPIREGDALWTLAQRFAELM